MTKCKGGCQMKSGGKTCAKCGCDMSPIKMANGGETYKSGGSACMKCGGKTHKSGGTISSCMKCGGGKYTFGGKTGWSKKKVTDKYASGGMIKRDNGSYALGGTVDMPCPDGFVRVGNDCVPAATAQDSTDVYNKALLLDNFYKKANYDLRSSNKFTGNIFTELNNDYNAFISTINDPEHKAKKMPAVGMLQNDGNGYTYTDKYATEKDYRKSRNTNKPYAVEQREKTFWALNESAPYGYYDTRIQPQFVKKYRDKPEIDVAEVYIYDPLAVKPHGDRTPAEHVAYQQKYGNYGGAKYPWNPYAVRVPETKYTEQDLENAFKQRKEQEDYAAYENWISENPLAEPEPRVNNEMEIDPWKIINMPTKSPELIQRNDPFRPKVYAGPGLAGRVKSYVPGEMWTKGPLEESRSLQEQHADDPSVILNPEEFIRKREELRKIEYKKWNKKEKSKMKRNKKYSFGGAISSMKQYDPGGEVSKTGNRNTDLALTLNNMFKVMKAENDKKYTGVTSGGYKYYRDKEGIPVVQIPDSELQYDEEGNYDDEIMVKSSKVANTLDAGKQGKASNVQLDYSLPNWGYAKLEQKKLNDLIQAEIKAGAKDLELLVEDDIIGENTLKAMNKFEGKGYTRPEGFKDKWLKKYAEDYAKGVRMQVPGVTAPLTPKVPGKESVKTTDVKVEEDASGNLVTKKKTDKASAKKEKNEISIFDILGGASSMMGGFTSGLYDATAGLINMAGKAGEFIDKYQDKSDTKEARLKAKREKLDRYIENQKNMPLFQEKANKLYQQKMEEDKKMALLANEKATKINEKINKEKQQKRIELVDNMMYMPMFEDKVEKIKQQIQDDQYEKLARDIEAKYETEAKEAKEQSYKNFGKKSAAASAEAAMKNSTPSKGSSSNTNINVGQPKINVSSSKQNASTSFDKTMKYMDELQRKNNNNEAYKSLSSEMNDKYYNVNESNATKVKNETFSKPSKGEGFDGKDDFLVKMLDIVIESEKNYGAPSTGYNIAFENNIASVRYNNKTNERIVNQVYPKDKVEKNLKVLNSAYNEVNKDYDKYYDEGKKKGIKGKDLVLYAYEQIKYKINRTRNKIKAENDPRFKPL
jgi:hypothetical protein